MSTNTETGPTDNLSDAELVRRFVEGEDNALDLLITRHRDPLYRFCYHLVSNRDDAEDICQESLARAVTHAGTLRSGNAFRSWLFTTARRLSIDVFRKQRRTLPLPEDAESPSLQVPGPQESVETGEEYRTLMQALQSLRENYRQVLILREIEGLSYAEIAQRLNVSQGAVELLLYRARRRLRQEYGRHEGEQPGIGLIAALRWLGSRLPSPAGGVATAVAKLAVMSTTVGLIGASVLSGPPAQHEALARPVAAHGSGAAPALPGVDAVFPGLLRGSRAPFAPPPSALTSSRTTRPVHEPNARPAPPARRDRLAVARARSARPETSRPAGRIVIVTVAGTRSTAYTRPIAAPNGSARSIAAPSANTRSPAVPPAPAAGPRTPAAEAAYSAAGNRPLPRAPHGNGATRVAAHPNRPAHGHGPIAVSHPYPAFRQGAPVSHHVQKPSHSAQSPSAVHQGAATHPQAPPPPAQNQPKPHTTASAVSPPTPSASVARGAGPAGPGKSGPSPQSTPVTGPSPSAHLAVTPVVPPDHPAPPDPGAHPPPPRP